MAIRLLIADDQEVVRQGLKKLFEGTEIKVIAEADNCSETISLAQAHRPNIVVLDISLVDQAGKKAFERLGKESPHTPILVLSVEDSPLRVAQVRESGAAGYLSKRCNCHELLSAVREVVAGNGVWPNTPARRFDSPTSRFVNMDVSLTSRQLEVLRCLASGFTTKEIAKALHIHYDTAKEHVQNIIRKTGARSRTHAAVWAVRQGIA